MAGLSLLLRTSVVLAALVLAAGSAATPLAGYAPDDVPGITVITRAQAEDVGLKAESFSMSFADGQDGTDLIVEFLRAAQANGARYVSGIEILVVSEDRGVAQDCLTRVLPADHGALATTAVEPGHQESHMVMREVTTTVNEKQVTRWQHQLEHAYVPPRWSTELSWVSDWDLYETPPACLPLTRRLSDPSRPHLVRATVYSGEVHHTATR